MFYMARCRAEYLLMNDTVGRLSVEEAIRTIREKVAILRYLSETAANNPECPDSAVLRGLGTVCRDVEAVTGRLKSALDTATLDAVLPNV
jgi:hypothetical protein